MYKKLFYLFIFYLISCNFHLAAQDLGIGDAKEYTIADIKVTGTTNYNEQTVIAFTGLRKGDKIYIPGDKISNVIKKLWDLDLFSDINFYVTNIADGQVYLELEIIEVPELDEVIVKGLKIDRQNKKLIKDTKFKSGIKDTEHDEGSVKRLKNDRQNKKLNKITKLKTGKKVTENLIANTQRQIQNKYRDDGFLNARAKINTREAIDTTDSNVKKVDMLIDVDKGKKVKVKQIEISGNEVFSNAKIRRQMKTKRKNFLRFFRRSKYIRETYRSDKEKIIDKYKSEGYRDARIVSDTMIKLDDKNIALKLQVEEGEKCHFGESNFLGNSKYSDEQLHQILRINKGDTYNGVLLNKRIADHTNPDADDITNLYQNNGYLFSQINPVETKVYNDTIDFEIRIFEGKVAHFNNVYVTGNDRTNDPVIYRNLRTRPGQQYSKQDVVRSIRELGQLGFFDAERLNPEFENVDPNS